MQINVSDRTQWPTRSWRPLVAILGALLVGAGAIRLWQMQSDLLPREYLLDYARLTVLPVDVPFWNTYTLIRDGDRPALPRDEGVFTRTTVKLTDRDRHRAWLRAAIYDGRPLWRVLLWPIIAAGASLLPIMAWAVSAESQTRWAAFQGTVISGIMRVSVARWNRAIPPKDRGPVIRLTGFQNLYLSRSMLTQHISIEGAQGSGKSQLANYITAYLLKQGPVIFLDPKREFVQQYAGPDDWILDPGDDRCPRWGLELENYDEMRATAPATSAFPDRPHTNPFFRIHPRFIIAYILATRRPTTKELALLLAGPREIARLLGGTELSHSVAGGHEMASSMLASLAELGRSIKFWPNDPGRRVFSVSEWARTRKGNIFFTSSPDTLDALKPSQSMILDMLILAMQKHPGPGALILDEVAQAMDRLPKLESAISLQRAAGNPIVLIFQELSQLKEKYGDLHTALVSQPFLHFGLRTKEKKSAEHTSSLLGEQEVERIRESRSRSGGLFSRTSITFQTERVNRPAVSIGDIQRLKPLEGFAAQGDYVTRFKLKYSPPMLRAPRLIERFIESSPAIQSSSTVATQALLPLDLPTKKRSKYEPTQALN